MNDESDLFQNETFDVNQKKVKENLGCNYGCSIFDLKK
jgi:hypothetical protein